MKDNKYYKILKQGSHFQQPINIPYPKSWLLNCRCKFHIIWRWLWIMRNIQHWVHITCLCNIKSKSISILVGPHLFVDMVHLSTTLNTSHNHHFYVPLNESFREKLRNLIILYPHLNLNSFVIPILDPCQYDNWYHI